MAISKEDILEAIGSMSVLDLSELIKEMEEKFGVSAAAAVAAAPAAAPAAASVSEEKDSWTLNIINVLVSGKLSFARGDTLLVRHE